MQRKLLTAYTIDTSGQRKTVAEFCYRVSSVTFGCSDARSLLSLPSRTAGSSQAMPVCLPYHYCCKACTVGIE
jgi:hypothetical protein